MPENITTSAHIRTSQRRKGQRLSREERERAQDIFLKSFANNANVRAACAAAGIDRSAMYAWLEHDEPFSLRYKQAELDANDAIRAAIFQRGVLGYEKPVVSMGKVVYGQDGKPLMERVYSDAMLALLAKARMPEFREKQQVEHSGTIATKQSETSDLSEEDLRLVMELAQQLRKQKDEQSA